MSLGFEVLYTVEVNGRAVKQICEQLFIEREFAHVSIQLAAYISDIKKDAKASFLH
jgi:hypothetical protein